MSTACDLAHELWAVAQSTASISDVVTVMTPILESALHAEYERGREYNGTPKSDPDYAHSEAALLEQAAEPVAWAVYVGDEKMKSFDSLTAAEDWARREKVCGSTYVYHIRALYASPPKREPLTDDGIHELVKDSSLDWQRGFGVDVGVNRYAALVRLAERAHGIGDE